MLDGRGWLPESVAGLDVLCLASGGGWQSILYAVAGANVTVVDISDSMLELDRREAQRRGLKMETLRASMDDLRELSSRSFDIVHQPVSTCYIPDLVPLYAEIARVLRDDGIYISQHKTPVSLQADLEGKRGGYVLREKYYQSNQTPLPPTVKSRLREEGTAEFLHRWEEIVGGMCRSGFVIEDLIEPNHARENASDGEFGHRCQFVAPYVRMKARRVSVESNGSANSIWIPT